MASGYRGAPFGGCIETERSTSTTRRLRFLAVAEVPGLENTRLDRLGRLLAARESRFARRALDLYFGTYLNPHLARALMVSGAEHIHPLWVLACHDPEIDRLSLQSFGAMINNDPSLPDMLTEALPRLTRDDVIFATIEMAASRRFSGGEPERQAIERWLAGQGHSARKAIWHFARFGFDCFPARRGETALRMTAAACRGAIDDPFAELSPLAASDDPSAHFGLMELFGLLQAESAIPYLSECLRDRRKQFRQFAVRALGRIGTPDALARVRQALQDPAKQVHREAQRFL